MQLLIELKEKGKIAIDKDDLHEVKDEETTPSNTTHSIKMHRKFKFQPNLKIYR
jgi:hypothetical protein